MQYEDLHSGFRGGQAYTVPNEEKAHWRDMVKGLHINRAAAICSAGEVGLFALLPTVRQELVLFDHSYNSLYIAMVKYTILKEKGAEAANKIFTSGDRNTIHAAVQAAVKALPSALVEPVHGSPYARESFEYAAHTLKDEWNNTPRKLIKHSCTKLGKVSFVHGDITDLIDKGPFDLLYLSNALEHTDRTGKSPVHEKVEKVVKPGGYILACHQRSYGHQTNPPERWERVQTIDARQHTRSYSILRWTHTLYRVPVQEAVAA